MNKILNYFTDNHPSKTYLEQKWWHRLFKVFFFSSVILVFILSGLIFHKSIEPTTLNSKIIIDLNTFTKNNDPNLIDTIPSFLELNGNLGCIDRKKKNINHRSSYLLEKSICTADVGKNLKAIARILPLKIDSYSDVDVQEIEESLRKIIARDSERRYCFIHNDVDCSSHDIVKYKGNIVFYFQVAGYVILVLTTWSLFWLFFYYKVILYIVYGNNKFNQ